MKLSLTAYQISLAVIKFMHFVLFVVALFIKLLRDLHSYMNFDSPVIFVFIVITESHFVFI